MILLISTYVTSLLITIYKKVLVLISDVMVWNETPKKVKEKVVSPPKEGEEGEEGN